MRDIKIDVFKGLLVFGMILAHVIYFFCNQFIHVWASYTTSYLKLISFSGFVFSFGYVCKIAYFNKNVNCAYPRMLANALRLLLAFYISGIVYRVLVTHVPLTLSSAANIVMLTDIPGFSEFLIAFSLIILLAIVLFKPINILLMNKDVFWLVIAVLLFTTQIPYEKITINQIGLFIGTNNFSAFPVLQYMPYFLLGAYFSAYKIEYNRNIFIGAFIATLLYVLNIIVTGSVPERFPPTFFHIIGAAFIVYIYYLGSIYIAKLDIITDALQFLGRKVLAFLLVSNLMIFAIKFLKPDLLLDLFGCILATILMIGMIGCFTLIIERARLGFRKQIVEN